MPLSFSSSLLLCVLKTEQIDCFTHPPPPTHPLPWLLNFQHKSPRTGLHFPLQWTASLGIVAQTVECGRAEGASEASRPPDTCSSLWPDPGALELVCPHLAHFLSRSVRGSLTLELTLLIFTLTCMQNTPHKFSNWSSAAAISQVLNITSF